MKNHLGGIALLGVLFLSSGLNGYRPLQEIDIKITPDQDSYVAGVDNPPPVFRISTRPNSLVCIELAINKKTFNGIDRVDGLNFFSSLFGDVEVKGEEIMTDDEGNAEYKIPIGLWGSLGWGDTFSVSTIYYRAAVIDKENSDLANKNAAILATTLSDEAWREAPNVQVFASAEEKHEYDQLAEVRGPFESGIELYKIGGYEDAIGEFRKADEIISRGSFSYWIAFCHLQLARTYAENALEHSTTSGRAKEHLMQVLNTLKEILPDSEKQ